MKRPRNIVRFAGNPRPVVKQSNPAIILVLPMTRIDYRRGRGPNKTKRGKA